MTRRGLPWGNAEGSEDLKRAATAKRCVRRVTRMPEARRTRMSAATLREKKVPEPGVDELSAVERGELGARARGLSGAGRGGSSVRGLTGAGGCGGDE